MKNLVTLILIFCSVVTFGQYGGERSFIQQISPLSGTGSRVSLLSPVGTLKALNNGTNGQLLGISSGTPTYTSIKTINGSSLLGSGDLTVSSNYIWGLQVDGGTVENTNDGNVWNFKSGTNITLSRSGKDLTFDVSGIGTGTVTSVGLSAPTGFSVTGSPVTGSGTLGLAFASGYSLPTTTKQSQWDDAYSKRISTFTTVGNSGAATFVGNNLNIPQYTLAGLGGIGEAPTGQVHYRTNTGWKAATLSSTLYTNYMYIFYTANEYLQIDKATTSTIGLMSAADKTSLDGLVTDKGKVKVQGESTYGFLSNSYFYTAAGVTYPIVSSTIDDGETAPVETNAVYDGLALKADLSGASFTGAISSTSTMTATDFILQSSDRRLKKNIRPIQADWVKDVKFVQFRLKSDLNKRTRYGVIAQDLEKIAPDLVVTNKDGYKSVAYTDLLIAKIAELEKRIKQLEDEK